MLEVEERPIVKTENRNCEYQVYRWQFRRWQRLKTITDIPSILMEMQELLAIKAPEYAHSIADHLVLKLVILLSKNRDDELIIEQILQAWKAIPKWYS